MEVLNMENINEIWGYACSGEIENLKAYYENGGQKDARYYGCGKYHSLIMGALRNEQYETVEYLLSVGETVRADEVMEFNSAYGFEKSIERLEELFRASLDWMRQHMPKDEYINVMYEKLNMTPGEIVKYSNEY